MNLPNRLTILRICMIPLFVVAFFLPYDWAPYVALAIFVLAAFTDFLDGFIARKYNLVTDLGKLLDPIADKILVTAALFCVVATNPFQWLEFFYGNSLSQFPWQTVGMIFLAVCATMILARELLVDAVRMIAASKGKVVQANIFGKIKTVLQDVTLPLLILCGEMRFIPHSSVPDLLFGSNDIGTFWFVVAIIAAVLMGLATIMTILSGTIYLIQNKSVFTAPKQQDK